MLHVNEKMIVTTILFIYFAVPSPYECRNDETDYGYAFMITGESLEIPGEKRNFCCELHHLQC